MAEPPENVITPALTQKALKLRKEHESGVGRMKTAGFFIIVSLAGVLLALIIAAAANPNAAPDCQGQMSPGDTCFENGHSYSYRQMQQQDDRETLIWEIVGWCAAGLGGALAVATFVSMSPKKPWGTAVNAMCPVCGRPNLRERRLNYTVTRNRRTWRCPRFVTVCGDGCAYAWCGRESMAARLQPAATTSSPYPAPGNPGYPASAPPAYYPNPSYPPRAAPPNYQNYPPNYPR